MFSNRTRERLTISLIADGKQPAAMTLDVGQSRPSFYRESLRVRYDHSLTGQTVEVKPKSAYFFTRGAGGDQPLRMEQIGFGDNQPARSPLAPIRMDRQEDPSVITVKLLVDDDEPTHRRLWEARLRSRLGKASEILDQHCGLRLKVIDVETWDSDDRQHDLNRSLREFEREVVPDPARLAIGFSSQYRAFSGRQHVGGTRGALYPYIMLKERSPKQLESQRLELLLHELGHYLGASHSPEPQSIMRPLLTSSVQRQAGARIQYDPVNTLLMSMLADEIRGRNVKSLWQVSRPTKIRMQEIYSVLVQAMPQDPAAAQYLQLLGARLLPQQRTTQASPAAKPVTQPQLKPEDRKLAGNAQRLMMQLRQVVRARRPPETDEDPTRWYQGDKLTEFYVRQLALTALQTEPDEIQQVYLVALGVYFDSAEALTKFPATEGLVARIENSRYREERLKTLGTPTIHDRADLALHFFISAHLTAVMGPGPAFQVGLAKEVADAAGESGFSFVDLAADLAGIEFARHVQSGEITLEQLSEGFAVEQYMPSIDGLEEGLSPGDLRDKYGDLQSDAFKAHVRDIQQRVLQLSAYD